MNVESGSINSMGTENKADREPAFSEQVRVEELRPTFLALKAAVTRQGIAAERSDTLLVECLSASCNKCGIPVSGSDLLELSQTAAGAAPDESKVSRLANGYCARKNCEAYYYTLCFAECEGVNWEAVWGEAHSTVAEEQAARPAGVKRATLISQIIAGMGMRNTLALIAFLLLLGVLAWMHFRTPGYSKNASGYEVEQDSVIQYQVEPEPQPRIP